MNKKSAYETEMQFCVRYEIKARTSHFFYIVCRINKEYTGDFYSLKINTLFLFKLEWVT